MGCRHNTPENDPLGLLPTRDRLVCLRLLVGAGCRIGRTGLLFYQVIGIVRYIQRGAEVNIW